ncbi:sigma-70 family RNA polymerase sigma factor [Companilactobacillus mishanensis]|uniref:Sigma-70 family RNA polymerase sigma factor n=1 Tax=Companilactobacillus mishanensis TaxID=2486008 RepID=A0ABW9P8G8_9LACO|nr:sigma-70 family RNA polymerase sigma factor [Companilactobacillus mishanensis]MQS45232.1 sigma-70 family RNA polymerase sigma factor [Companilactobacillus mishanensis]
MDLTTGFAKAIENEQLIHGVMKRVHIYQMNDNYQDYVQEAMIIYAKAYVDYLAEERDVEKFNVYIFQKLVWRMTDLLRSEKKFFDIHSLEVFDFERVEQVTSEDFFEDFDLDCLTYFERGLFFDCFIQQIPLSKLADKYECSDRNLRYHRDNIKAKLRKRFS